jgi:hypothetical protein
MNGFRVEGVEGSATGAAVSKVAATRPEREHWLKKGSLNERSSALQE